MNRKQEVDLLHGSIGDKLITFALPVAATGILQQLFNAADVAVVGQFCGKDAMAAVGSNSSLIALMLALFMGISLGANVVIANSVGRGDREGIRRAVGTAVLVAIIGGICMMLFGELLATRIIGLLGVPDEVFSMAVLYLRIYMIGFPVILLYYFESAIFRSIGNTRTPLYCLTAAGLINVGLNLFFVCVVGMDVDGVATATVISNVVSSTLLFVSLCRTDSSVKIQPRMLRIHSRELRKMLFIGIPAGIQGAMFSASNVIIQSAINSLGSDIMAASAAAFNIEILAYYVINSFGQACTTFTGQNYGAGNPDRCRRILKVCLTQSLIVTVAVSATLILLGRPLLLLFNSDPTVLYYGYRRLLLILTFEFLDTVIEIMSGCLRGFGHSLEPAIITLFGVCVFRVTWVYTAFRAFPTFTVLLTSYPLSWVIAAVLLIIAYFRIKRHALRPFFNPPQNDSAAGA